MSEDKDMVGAPCQQEEEAIHAFLMRQFAQIGERDADMPFDPEGKTAFMIVSLNHPTADNMPADSNSNDRLVALLASSLLVCPNIKPDEEGNVQAGDVLNEGVHAVAANILADMTRRHVIDHVIGIAQEHMIEWRSNHDD